MSSRQFSKVYPNKPRVAVEEKVRSACCDFKTHSDAGRAVVNPLFVDSRETPRDYNFRSELEMDVLPMYVPPNLTKDNKLTRTEEVRYVKTCAWGLEPKEVITGPPASVRLPRHLVILLAIMFVMCTASILMTILMLQGKIGCGSCPCCGSTAPYIAKEKKPTELGTLKEQVKQLVEKSANDRQDFDKLRNSTMKLDVLINTTSSFKAKMNLNFELLLNLTHEQMARLRQQTRKSANATIAMLQGARSALKKTETKLAHLRQLWVELNSTNEDIQRLGERTDNFTGETQARFALMRSKALLVQQCCTNQSASLAHLSNKIINVSKMPGPIGPPGCNGSRGFNGSQGPAGPPGPKGAGNFSQCLYKFAKSSRIVPAAGITQFVTVTEQSGKRIIGATCSTDNAKEYGLSVKTTGANNDKLEYKCDCAGLSDLLKRSADQQTIRCFIHYWECPLET